MSGVGEELSRMAAAYAEDPTRITGDTVVHRLCAYTVLQVTDEVLVQFGLETVQSQLGGKGGKKEVRKGLKAGRVALRKHMKKFNRKSVLGNVTQDRLVILWQMVIDPLFLNLESFFQIKFKQLEAQIKRQLLTEKSDKWVEKIRGVSFGVLEGGEVEGDVTRSFLGEVKEGFSGLLRDVYILPLGVCQHVYLTIRSVLSRYEEIDERADADHPAITMMQLVEEKEKEWGEIQSEDLDGIDRWIDGLTKGLRDKEVIVEWRKNTDSLGNIYEHFTPLDPGHVVESGKHAIQLHTGGPMLHMASIEYSAHNNRVSEDRLCRYVLPLPIVDETLNVMLIICCDGNRSYEISEFYAKNACEYFLHYLTDTMSCFMAGMELSLCVSFALDRTGNRMEDLAVEAIQAGTLPVGPQSTLLLSCIIPNPLQPEASTMVTFCAGDSWGVANLRGDICWSTPPSHHLSVLPILEGDEIIISSDGIWHTVSPQDLMLLCQKLQGVPVDTAVKFFFLLSLFGRDDDRNPLLIRF